MSRKQILLMVIVSAVVALVVVGVAALLNTKPRESVAEKKQSSDGRATVIITRNRNLPAVLGIADGSKQSGVEVIFLDPDDPKIAGVIGAEPTWKQTPPEERNAFFNAGGFIVYRTERQTDGKIKILDEIQFDSPPRNRRPER